MTEEWKAAPKDKGKQVSTMGNGGLMPTGNPGRQCRTHTSDLSHPRVRELGYLQTSFSHCWGTDGRQWAPLARESF